MSHTRKRARLADEASEGLASASMVSQQKNGHDAQNVISGKGAKQTDGLHELYSESVEAKIWGIASRQLHKPTPPTFLPEYTEPGGNEYVYRELSFWTSGFFPGSLYLLLERQRKYAHILGAANRRCIHQLQLDFACRWWTENLHANATLEGTHDLGFMIMPWARRSWELNRDARAFESMKAAAKTLAARFNPKIGAMRSWDTCTTKVYDFKHPESEFLVIIDNMMNLDLLFYVAAQTGDTHMYEVAVAHAKATQKAHIRKDRSTIHLVVFDPITGEIRSRLTNQGHSTESCWTRGQAWAIAGFAETYHWTHDLSFLETARECADYFLERLPPSAIPPWDFDAAEKSNTETQPTDTSAAMIAAYGMILLHQALSAKGEQSEYLAAALRITGAVCRNHLNSPASFSIRDEVINTVEHGLMKHAGHLEVDMGVGEAILNGATINNFEFAPRRWTNHSLVYADYFFLLVGNKLLELGLAPPMTGKKDELPNGKGIVNGTL